MSRPKQQSVCHPEKEHYGKGLCRACYMKQYVRKNFSHHHKVRRNGCKKLKRKVLTLYGKNKNLQCCWRGCTIKDLDMLTLDHKNDDGFLERKTTKGSGSVVAYRAALSQVDFEKYQTLCWNHQWKKRIKSLESSQVEQDGGDNT
jgi:hypothetical protein